MTHRRPCLDVTGMPGSVTFDSVTSDVDAGPANQIYVNGSGQYLSFNGNADCNVFADCQLSVPENMPWSGKTGIGCPRTQYDAAVVLWR
jgi:hypothetical protein